MYSCENTLVYQNFEIEKVCVEISRKRNSKIKKGSREKVQLNNNIMVVIMCCDCFVLEGLLLNNNYTYRS